MNAKLKQALSQIVGPNNFTASLIDLVSYSYDASEHDHRPSAAVWPLNTERVSAVLRFANENKIPVIPRGLGPG